MPAVDQPQDLKLWVAFSVTVVACMQAIIGFKYLEVRIGLYPTVTSQHSSTTLYQVSLQCQ